MLTGALSKSRRCKQQRGQRHKQILQLLHGVTPASVRYTASGWLMLTVLAPSRYAALLRTARGGPNAAKLKVFNGRAPPPSTDRSPPAESTHTPEPQRHPDAAP